MGWRGLLSRDTTGGWPWRKKSLGCYLPRVGLAIAAVRPRLSGWLSLGRWWLSERDAAAPSETPRGRREFSVERGASHLRRMPQPLQ